jgi:hypothetical protein
MKSDRIVKLAIIAIASFSFSRLECRTAAAQAAATQPNYTSEGFQGSIASVKMNRQTVTIEFLLKNISQFRQYVSYCTAAGGASLTSGDKLQFDTSKFNGIPHNSSSDMSVCLRTTTLENMSYLEPNASMVIMLAWSNTNGNPVPLNASISFPFIFVARTAAPPPPIDTPETRREPGHIHAVNIHFPLIPLSQSQ